MPKVTAGENIVEIRLVRKSISKMTDRELLEWVESTRGPRSMSPTKKAKGEKSKPKELIFNPENLA